MSPLQNAKAQNAATATKPAPSKAVSAVWRGQACAFTTADGIYEWTACDDKIRPIRPFREPKTEDGICRLYCEPRAYHHSVEFLSEAPQGFFTFDELNRPEKWRTAISKFLSITRQGELSRAAIQLFRLVEEVRREFRAAQDRAWGDRKIGPRTPENYERKELRAWEQFSSQKQALLRQYERAIRTGVVKRVKQKAQRLCACGNPLDARRRKCDVCRRAARRDSVRQSKIRRRRKQLAACFT